MVNFVRFCQLLLLSCCSLLAHADELRDSLFGEADAALVAANEARANLLAPEHYSRGSEDYQNAKERFAKNGHLDRIRKDLGAAAQAFQQAATRAETAAVVFTTALRAREDALTAQASQHATELWLEASKQFVQAAERLENDKRESAEKLAQQAETLFRQAELSAIKANYLTETRSLIADARQRHVQRVAPHTLGKAEALLNEAENALSNNRYDVDEPRALAREARYEASRAVYIATLILPVAEGDQSLEQLILQMQQPVGQVAEALDIVPELNDQSGATTNAILNALAQLRLRSYELDEKNQALAQLSAEMKILEDRLGVQNERLARESTRRTQLAQLDQLFSDDEAVVMTQGPNVLLRMVGLNFAPSQAVIDSSYYALLKKVEQAIALFPDALITIEGHTDSFGGDAANAALSQQRADAVKTYLLAQLPLRKTESVTATGYGETRPIGNNETSDGRKRNRRIDLVIQAAH